MPPGLYSFKSTGSATCTCSGSGGNLLISHCWLSVCQVGGHQPMSPPVVPIGPCQRHRQPSLALLRTKHRGIRLAIGLATRTTHLGARNAFCRPRLLISTNKGRSEPSLAVEAAAAARPSLAVLPWTWLAKTRFCFSYVCLFLLISPNILNICCLCRVAPILVVLVWVCVCVLLLFCCYLNVWIQYLCVCVVHGCVCELTLRLASSSHFSYSQHLLVILGTLRIVLGLWSPFLSFL